MYYGGVLLLVELVSFLQRPQTSSVSAQPTWSYRVKIFDSTSKRSPRNVRDLHSFGGQFVSIKHLRQVLCAELGDDLPK